VVSSLSPASSTLLAVYVGGWKRCAILGPGSGVPWPDGRHGPGLASSAVDSGAQQLLTLASEQTMSSSETLTQKCLRQNIAAYNDGRVFADMDATLLHEYVTLQPSAQRQVSVVQ
jgi:hypothetical protein